jgi:SAM-dependent methyltransferase
MKLMNEAKGVVRDAVDRLPLPNALLGRRSDSRIVSQSQRYWQHDRGYDWRGMSHMREDSPVAGNTWHDIGDDHLALFTKLAKVVDDYGMGRVVEWGCGGGANAAVFAPHCDEYIGVDVAETQLAESARQVAQVCDTQFTPILIDVGNPEAAVELIPEKCDLFLCLYVLELVPSPEYGLRVLRVARELLADDGLAFVQIKYSTRSWRTLPRRRRYASHLADMTTYPIDEFWTAAERCGLRPQAVHIVPKTAVDERYAYFLLSRSQAS